MYSTVKTQGRKINHALAEALHLLQGTISSGGYEWLTEDGGIHNFHNRALFARIFWLLYLSLEASLHNVEEKKL